MDRRSKPGKRRLSEAERDLWERVAHGVTPLRSRHYPAGPAEAAERPGPPLAEPGPPARPVGRMAVRPSSPMPEARAAGSLTEAALTGLDRRTQQRLRRGRIEPDDRLDLHGMTQARAHAALRAFLAAAQARGAAIVLVITGKGSRQGDRYESESIWSTGGVLRRLVPEWLQQPDMRPYVSGLRDAHPRHGGSGALYVRIRKRRG